MIRRTLAIAVKEFLHLQRDPRVSVVLFGMPMLLLVLYGYVVSFDVKHIRLGIVDLDGSRAGRELAEAFVQSGHFDLAAYGNDVRSLDGLFDTGRIQAGLVLPADYGKNLALSRQAPVQFVLDGSDARMATTVLGYARQIAVSVSPVVRTKRQLAPVVGLPIVWYNPTLSTPRFLLPGLVGSILMITAVVATALAVVREKERGTMESLRATPLVALELLVGKTIPYLVIGSIAAAGTLLLAWGLFHVPMHGSLLWLALVTLLFLVGGLAWGVLISTVADTQQTAFQLGMITSMLPSFLLSGFVFPISSMPRVLRWVTHAVPARYFLQALREIVLKGVGPEVWWPQITGLAVYAGAVLLLATVRMVRQL